MCIYIELKLTMLLGLLLLLRLLLCFLHPPVSCLRYLYLYT
jgi:hypothetical protein